jgi:hypothetical protein
MRRLAVHNDQRLLSHAARIRLFANSNRHTLRRMREKTPVAGQDEDEHG